MPIVIYGLRCPRSGNIRYIGKTTDLRRRYLAHLACRNPRHPLYCWVASLKKAKLSPIIEVLQEIPDGADWASAERLAIEFARNDGWPLFNRTSGGDGAALTPQAKAEKKARMQSAETRARMSAAAKARWADPVKRAAAMRANTSKEKREQLSELARKRATSEYRAAQSERSRAAWANPEKRKRIISGITDDVRARVAAAAREMWRSDPERASRMRRMRYRPDTKALWQTAEYRDAQRATRATAAYKARASAAQRKAWKRRKAKKD